MATEITAARLLAQYLRRLDGRRRTSESSWRRCRSGTGSAAVSPTGIRPGGRSGRSCSPRRDHRRHAVPLATAARSRRGSRRGVGRRGDRVVLQRRRRHRRSSLLGMVAPSRSGCGWSTCARPVRSRARCSPSRPREPARNLPPGARDDPADRHAAHPARRGRADRPRRDVAARRALGRRGDRVRAAARPPAGAVKAETGDPRARSLCQYIQVVERDGAVSCI